ncbi:MAG: DegT/DnrJ/EryC1/StrS aminotransferase family protein [Pseudomonadota bacterium]
MSGWPVFDDEQIDAATAVLRSGNVNYWTGAEGRAFEAEFADATGCKHGIALANGSVALELALRGFGVGPGDEVVVTPRSFIASASSAVLCGARPVFADVDPDSQNITAETIRAVISPRTRAVIAVHLAGWPCDMDPIVALCRERGIKLIEDCAQAHGASYRGRPVGALGDAAAFSFCQDKIMTTAGEGGMLVTNDRQLWSWAWSFKDHGKNYDAVYRRAHPPGFRWLHESFGTNWRMTEIQAAIGRIQLRRLPTWLGHRRRNAAILTDRLQMIPALRVPTPSADTHHAFYKFYAFVQPESLPEGWNRDRLMNAINEKGVACFSGSCSEIYREKAFSCTDMAPGSRLPVARGLGETALMFLVDPTLSEEDMRRTADVVEAVLLEAAEPALEMAG